MSSPSPASQFATLLLLLGGGLAVAGLVSMARERRGPPRRMREAPTGPMPVEADPDRMDQSIEEQEDGGDTRGWW